MIALGVMDVVGTVALVWFAVSVLAGIAVALGGRHVFRKMPKPPASTVRHIDIHQSIDDDTTNAVITELNRRDRMKGRGF